MTTKIKVIVCSIAALLLFLAGAGAGWRVKRCPVVIEPGPDTSQIASLLFTPVVVEKTETRWKVKTNKKVEYIDRETLVQRDPDCRSCFERYEPIIAIAPAPRWSFNSVSGYAGFGVANLGQANNIGGQFGIDYKPVSLHGKAIHAALVVRAETFVSDSRIINPAISGGVEIKFGR